MLCSYVITHNFVIKSENKLQIPYAWLSFSTSFCHFLTKKMNFIIQISVDNFPKSNSYHFGGSRTRTLLTSSCAIESRESIHSSTGTCLYSWSNSMAHWSFPSPLSFLFALSMSHAISPFWLYTGETIFGQKHPFSGPKSIGFLRCIPRGKLPTF